MNIPGLRFLFSDDLARCVRCLQSQMGARLWGAISLLVAVAFLEGSGLVLLLPLLQALGISHGGGALFSPLGALRAAGEPHQFAGILAVFVLVKAAQAGLRIWSARINLRIETDFTCFLRERFYRDLIAADWLSVTRQRASDLSQALLDELPRVGLGTQQLLSFASLAVIALIQAGVAFALSPAMTLLAFGCGAGFLLGLRQMRRRNFALARAGQSQRREMSAAVTEHLAGLKLAKSHGRDGQHFEHFRQSMHDIARHALDRQRIGSITRLWIEVGSVAALSLFVYFAAEIRHVPTGRLLVLAFIFTRLLGHANQLQAAWQHIVELIPSFSATERLRAQLVAAAETPAASPVNRLVLRDAVRLDGVVFRYDPARPVAALAGIDLVLPSRRATALCGPSGAGKSTLADLVLGLIRPTAGRVTVDGLPLEGAPLHDWRRSVGYVPQETFLFHDTVRANLRWAEPAADEAALRAALRAAAAEEFVDRLPHGLDTILGDRGVRLSGGERQRIALARALLRRPTLLVLDEATSALDSHNERLVQDAIERLRGELTILLIAHRLSTVRFADRIIVLDGGHVVESGTWSELSAAPGAFRRLLAADPSA